MNLKEFESYLKNVKTQTEGFSAEANRQALESIGTHPGANMVAEINRHATGVKVIVKPVAGVKVNNSTIQSFARTIARDINQKLPSIVKGLLK
jgi:hypothetical protein